MALRHLVTGTALWAVLGMSLAHAQGAPANDDFVNAEPLAEGTWLGSNVGATSEPGEPGHASVPIGASIWFTWTAPTDGYLTVDTFGSAYDTVLAMYTGTMVDALSEVAANDDTFGRQSELANVPVINGTEYRIAVDGYSAAQGDVVLNVSFFDGTDTTAPTISIALPLEGATYVENGLLPAQYTCADETLGTGVATCEGDVAVGELLETATPGSYSFSVTATDVAGNSSTNTITYGIGGIDVTAPLATINTPAAGAVYSVGASIVADYGCIDELFGSGIADCTGAVPTGTPLDTSIAGVFDFTVTAVDGVGNSAQATRTYQIVDSPSNDNFASAQVLGPSGTWNGTNVGATVESGEPDHTILPSNASIWFRWTASLDGFLTADTTGSNFSNSVAMYTGEAVDALTSLSAHHGSGNTSALSNVPVTAGTTYSIAVDGYFGDTGLVTFNWSFAEQFDFEPPVITLWSPADGLVLAQGEPLWSGYSCFDPTPSTGLLSCEGPVPNGTLMDTSVPGNFTFTVTASDGAGNIAEASASYTVVGNPPNDDFAAATGLSGATGSVSGTNAGATLELSEPFHAGNVGDASVWFRLTAPGDGFLSMDTFGSDFNTLLAIYTGTAVNALTEIDANDDAVGAQSAIHDARVFAGVTYSVVIAGVWDASGNYVLNWAFEALNDTTPPSVAITSPKEGDVYFQDTLVNADYSCTDETLGSGIASCVGEVETLTPIDTSMVGPASFTVTGTDNWGNTSVQSVAYTVQAFSNDNFANALPIEGSGHLVATSIGASKEPGEPDHAGDTGGASVWFSWIAVEDGFLSVDTLLSHFDTTLAVYSGAALDALTELGSNDNSLGQQSQVRDVPVTAGVTYYIAVDGAGGASGQIDLDWITFTGPTFSEISSTTHPLWMTDANHDFWLNAAAPADLDGDGDLDLAAIGYFVEYNVGTTDRLVVFMNEGIGGNGEWQFTTQEVPLSGLISNESDLAFGDFDGDGDPDLAVAVEGTTALYRNDDGALVQIDADLPGYEEDSNYSSAYDLRSLTWADYDNDADLDLLIPSVRDEQTSARGTALMRNDGADGSGGWAFTQVPAQLDGTTHAQTAWADPDGDGDLDLFMTNVDNFLDNGFVRTYRNDGGIFTSAEPIGNLRVDYGLGDWADYDGDGDLDILIVGLVFDTDGVYKTLLRIYENVNGVYQPQTIVQSSFFPWLDLHAATWADYDSDGDVDILLTGAVIGEDNIVGKSEVYVNDNGSFVPLGRDLPAPVGASGNGGSFTWFDVDGDGDLDYFVAGAYFVEGGNGLIEAQMHLYRNDALASNQPPTAPSGLSTTEGTSDITLSWNPATDDTTPPEAITYDLRIAPQGDTPDVQGRAPEPGNIGTATGWPLLGLAPGEYAWHVRAVDSAFNASAFASGAFSIAPIQDGDNDGIGDDTDNCLDRENADQRDTDGDGFGNACDPDLNQDNVVNFLDLQIMKSVFFTANPHADLNGDGTVNFLDLVTMKLLFFQAPGPAGGGAR